VGDKALSEPIETSTEKVNKLNILMKTIEDNSKGVKYVIMKYQIKSI